MKVTTLRETYLYNQLQQCNSFCLKEYHRSNQNVQSSPELVYLPCFRMEGFGRCRDKQSGSSQSLLGTETLLNVVEEYALQVWLKCLSNRSILLEETSTMLFLLPSFPGSERYESWFTEPYLICLHIEKKPNQAKKII